MSLPRSADTTDQPLRNRRNFLSVATAAMGAAGAAMAAWPFIAQWNPDAGTRAADDLVEVNLADLAPARQLMVRWHNLPIFVVGRTAAMLMAMQQPAFVGRLVDPLSQKHQQPTYARNWHRSIDPAFAVLVGVCTACGCVPHYVAEGAPLVVDGGYLCPCCASHYDPAGRAYAGPAQYNLPVPPHEIRSRSRLRIGRNAGGDLFVFDSVERI